MGYPTGPNPRKGMHFKFSGLASPSMGSTTPKLRAKKVTSTTPDLPEFHSSTAPHKTDLDRFVSKFKFGAGKPGF